MVGGLLCRAVAASSVKRHSLVYAWCEQILQCITFHTTAVHGLHPTFLHLPMVVGYFLIELARSLSFRSGHKVTVSRAFINVLFEFVVQALLGGGREWLRFWRFVILLLRRAVYDFSFR